VALTAQADATRIGLRQDDLRAALSVFLLVSACALPAVLPFAVFADDFEALRVSNLALVGLLFITGFRWARHTMLNPWAVGSATAVLGLAMVGVAIALGG
jgi:VIT1/CCC1 family predicted Fe2+/Mn2+ transporter